MRPNAPTDGNSIHSLLDARAVPWRSTRQVLTERFGVRPHPAYQWDIIELATPMPILDHLLWPLSAQVQPQFAPHLPATYFSAAASFGENSRDNLRRTVTQLEPMLGKARTVERDNIVRCEWLAGAASLRLTVWPLDLHVGPPNEIDAHKREPRLPTACHIDIDTGFCLAATDAELTWIRSFVPVGRIRFYGATASEHDLEYGRAPVESSDSIVGSVGCSADQRALIFGQSQLFVIPMTDVFRFTVDRILPAKGSGGSHLRVDCRTRCETLSEKSLTISSAPGADDLNELAAKLASVAGKPLLLGDYESDC
jgi:hypothetical protein